jgi:hypothetical protein
MNIIDVFFGVLLAEWIMGLSRFLLHRYARHKENQNIVTRLNTIAALDAYRAAQDRGVRAPLG